MSKQISTNDGAQGEPQVRSSAVLAGFVVEAMVVNTDTMKSGWKEIARYPDRETAERVRDMNRRKGTFRVREEKPANTALSGAQNVKKI